MRTIAGPLSIFFRTEGLESMLFDLPQNQSLSVVMSQSVKDEEDDDVK